MTWFLAALGVAGFIAALAAYRVWGPRDRMTRLEQEQARVHLKEAVRRVDTGNVRLLHPRKDSSEDEGGAA